jgi:dienelactone hydrolase
MPVPLLLVLLLPVLLSGCYLSRSADLPDELGRTWRGATVAVPFSAVDPALADVTGRMAEVEDRLQAARPAARLPVVVFLHGCNGLHPGYRVDLGFLRAQGYAVVAPDSFARDYKPRSCDRHSKTGGFHPGVIGFRLAETAHALERVRAFPWVDPDRIVLMGQSEGGITTANWEGDGLAGRVILGWTCQIPWPPLRGLRGDRSTPVLSVVSRDDPWFAPWYVAGDCGTDMDGFADARSVVLDGATHHVLRLPEAQQAVAEFLARVAPTRVAPALARPGPPVGVPALRGKPLRPG